MEEMKIPLQSIWGKWWVPIRKWFYPLWLAYETLVRFYQYADSTHSYFSGLGSPLLGTFCGISAFGICAAFLTLPACFVLYQFFSAENLTGSTIEAKLKPYF